jgi:hypothetical protein
MLMVPGPNLNQLVFGSNVGAKWIRVTILSFTNEKNYTTSITPMG